MKNPKVEKSEVELELICPACGHYPMTLLGEMKGLDLKVTDGGVECPVCPYESKFE